MLRLWMRAAVLSVAAALFSTPLVGQTFDHPTGAFIVPVADGVFPFNSAGYALAGPAMSCNQQGADVNDVWLYYLAPATATVIFTVCPASAIAGGSISPSNSAIAVWDDAGVGFAPGNQLACQDAGGNCGVAQSEVTLAVTAAVGYYVQLTNWSGSAVISGAVAIGPLVLPPAFAGDDCVTAPPVSEGVWSYNSTGFSIPGPAQSCSLGGNARDCWLAYTPSVSGVATFSNCPGSILAPGGNAIAGINLVISVWDGSLCPPTNELGCAGGAPVCLGGQAEVSVQVAAGGVYYVQISNWGGASPLLAGNLAIAVVPTPTPAGPGDVPAVAVPHPTGVPVAYNSAGFTIAGPTAFCAFSASYDPFDFWFVFTAATSGIAVASTCPNSTFAPGGGASPSDTYLAAWDGSVSPPVVLLDCQYGSPNCGVSEAEVQFNVVAGATYYVQVGGWQATAPAAIAGAMNIAILPLPVNDECSTAIPIGAGTFTGYTLGATTSAPTGSCGAMGADVWFALTVPCAGGKVVLDTCGSVMDPVLSVWSACGGVELACNDDAGANGSCAFTPQSYLELTGLTAGQTVYVALGGFGGAPGAFTLNVTCDYAHAWSAPAGTGSIRLENVYGPPGALTFSAITLDILHAGLAAGVNFPNGWFFGVPMGFAELQSQVSWPGGLPFTGALDASGYLLNFSLPAGSLPGAATIWSVGVAFDPATGFSTIGDVTDPTSYP